MKTGQSQRPRSISEMKSSSFLHHFLFLNIINFCILQSSDYFEHIGAISMHYPLAKEEETKAAIFRPTFRFAPHSDRNTADLSSDPMATEDEEKGDTALNLEITLQHEITARTYFIVILPAKAEEEDLHSASNHCSLCTVSLILSKTQDR